MSEIVVAALYAFARLPDYREMRAPLLARCRELGIRGSLLLADEGINGTVAGSREGIDALRAYLASDSRLTHMEYKESSADSMPFHRMKVPLKKEIVTMGEASADPTQQVGTYVPAAEWNELISDPDVVLIDTRNDYETRVGTFRGAVDPDIRSFREFPEYVRTQLDPGKHKKVAMFCTGGIRCEKATSFLLAEGFEEVFHLQGGILRYLEEVAEDDSLWDGECFVFDQRVAVGHGLKQGSYSLCHGCRSPLSDADRASPLYEEGVSCPYCHTQRSQQQKAAAAERQRQVLLAEARGRSHIGPNEADTDTAQSNR